MAFNTYTQGLKKASDLANKAITTESSLSSLSPLVSPLPTLQKTFPLYISAAESYSHLTASNLVPEADKPGIKKKWRLVLERAEKVKKRIEELGGHVGKVETTDEGEEDAIRRRGGRLNGLDLNAWSFPHDREFSAGRGMYRDAEQPELAKEQLAMEPIWEDISSGAWGVKMSKEDKWVLRQGPGADCSVVAGVCACLDHNRRWGTTLVQDALWPQSSAAVPQQSDNGKHVVKLLLNGAWRQVIIDALLPHSSDHAPLYATSHPLDELAASTGPSSSGEELDPAWIPLVLKAYFKAHGGYSLRGSNPAPDIHTLTGWIPERINLQDNYPREKEWTRLFAAWCRGEVILTLGTGEKPSGDGLVPLHAYAILGMREEEDERVLDVYDPGIAKLPQTHGIEIALNGLHLGGSSSSGIFKMSWDSVCADFETLNLDWSPEIKPVQALRHWSWAKPLDTGNEANMSNPRYRLKIAASPLHPGEDVWILLSQHVSDRDRPLDDIALHVDEEIASSSAPVPSLRPAQSHRRSTPFSNAAHVLVRHTLRKAITNLDILPIRDRGIFRTDFTLQAFSSSGTSLSLDRIARTLPFSTSYSAALTSRNARGHSGLPSWMDNPQYKIVLSPPARDLGERHELRVVVKGDAEMAWNAKLLWGKGELVYEWTEELAVADSGAYAHGVAVLNDSSIKPGTYTMVISAFDPRQTGKFDISLESSLPVHISPIPAEGAGMYVRSISSVWTETTSGGRPSAGNYEANPTIEVTLPQDCSLMARGLIPVTSASSVPLNLTLYKRGAGGKVGEQISTSGPYSDTLSGVRIPRVRVQKGVYVLVLSTWEQGMGVDEKWETKVWADGPLEVELA